MLNVFLLTYFTKKLDLAIIESDTDIEINQARLELDTNGNGYIDTAESERNASSDAARLRAVDRLENRKRVQCRRKDEKAV